MQITILILWRNVWWPTSINNRLLFIVQCLIIMWFVQLCTNIKYNDNWIQKKKKLTLQIMVSEKKIYWQKSMARWKMKDELKRYPALRKWSGMGRLEGLDICYFISQLNKKWISKRRKINENKSEFFKKINQVKKYLARLYFFFFKRENIHLQY